MKAWVVPQREHGLLLIENKSYILVDLLTANLPKCQFALDIGISKNLE